MKFNLLPRFIIIIVVAIVATYVAVRVPPKLGIDLAGGSSLVYELNLDKIPTSSNENRMQMAQRVVEVLKKRVDPLGQKNIIWRVLEQGKRIQIQMPFPPQTTRDAKTLEEKEFAALQTAAWKESGLREAVKETGAARDAALAKLAPKESPEYKLLQEMAAAWDQLSKANTDLINYKPGGTDSQETLLAARRDADQKFEDLLADAMSKSVNPESLRKLVTEADDPDDDTALQTLQAYPDRYPLQKSQIQAYLKAHADLIALSGGGVNDTAELKRLVTKAGVLDFRIAVLPNEIGQDQLAEAIRILTQKGPDEQVDVGGIKAKWFQIDPKGKESLTKGGYVTAAVDNQPYILCYDDHDHTLTHADPKRESWSVTANSPYTDPTSGELMLPFNLDPKGAGYMGQMTLMWKQHPMTILLDDKAMSAPTIQGQISDHGTITFGKGRAAAAILKEAQQLKAIMDAGSLPATLRGEPISEETISSDMGQDNIDRGVHSAYIAVACVVGFMCLYYTITGVFADLALMLNLALVMATMAMLQATFTLPGIAGLVLTLGMAVDANVLINERIREEVHRGASLWMAIKQGYDKVFWTIFDANLTTSLTSIVLIYVGSEEVKGFGITLLIGLCIHMFTALFVTRTLMTAAAQWGIIKAIDDHSIAEYIKELVTFTWLRNGHWPFMRVITVSNINWIGKRYIFWGISAVVMLAGLAAFVGRGEDKYDIEFRGGTQVTMQLIDPYEPLRQSLLAVAQDPAAVKDHPALKELASTSDTTVDEQNKSLVALAEEVGKDAGLVKNHPDVATYPAMLADAKTKTLTIDEVRHRVEALAALPNLGELRGARVYAIGKEGSRRYQMQTTIANHKQDLEKTLPGPLGREFAGAIDPKSVKIEVESDGTTVHATMLPLNGQIMPLSEVRQHLAALAKQPDLADLAQSQAKMVGETAARQIEIDIPNQGIKRTLLEPLADAFKDVIETKPALAVANANVVDVKDLSDAGYLAPIGDTQKTLDEVFRATPFNDMPRRNIEQFKDGAAFVLDKITPPITAQKLTNRIMSMRQSSQFSSQHSRDFAVMPITVLDAAGKPVAAAEDDARPMVRAVLLTTDPAYPYDDTSDAKLTTWRTKVAGSEWAIIQATLTDSNLFDGVTSFDAVVASQAKLQALLAIVLSLVLIVIYVWVRFGGFLYGMGAILSLVHDAIVALAATVLSGVVINGLFHGKPFLLVTDFKINLTMIAAYLTVIGYSVNDTIVIFDRVRELRGKSNAPLTPRLVNDAINQCFGRTIWTTFTVFIVVLIMYIWGGEGVRGFSFAMLIGVITGAYSTLAIASPMLLTTGAGGGSALKGPNPFQSKQKIEVQ